MLHVLAAWAVVCLYELMAHRREMLAYSLVNETEFDFEVVSAEGTAVGRPFAIRHRPDNGGVSIEACALAFEIERQRGLDANAFEVLGFRPDTGDCGVTIIQPRKVDQKGKS